MLNHLNQVECRNTKPRFFVTTRRNAAGVSVKPWFVPSPATLLAPLPVLIIAVMGFVLGDERLGTRALEVSLGLFVVGMAVRAARLAWSGRRVRIGGVRRATALMA